jgi:hypothetical protein
MAQTPLMLLGRAILSACLAVAVHTQELLQDSPAVTSAKLLRSSAE